MCLHLFSPSACNLLTFPFSPFFHCRSRLEIDEDTLSDVETLKVQIYSLTGVDINDLVVFVEGIAGPIISSISLPTSHSGSSSSLSSSSSPTVVAILDRSKHLLSRLGAGPSSSSQRIDDWPLSLVDAALKQQVQEAQINGQSESVNMSQRLLSGAKHVKCYEDINQIEKALKVIPVAELLRKATEAFESQQISEKAIEATEVVPTPIVEKKKTFQYLLLVQLTQWFKHRFFKWANNISCSTCGGGETDGIGGAPPTAEERMIGWAGMVELYKCRACKSVTRFPRLNNPAALLDSKIGRCGEWANCFTLCCLALGFEARHVHDWTDHVWTEVFMEEEEGGGGGGKEVVAKMVSGDNVNAGVSSGGSVSGDANVSLSLSTSSAAGIVKGRWIHVDSCEAAIDAPLLYEGGWGKKLNYVIAFGLDEVVDVSRRYTRDFSVMLTRRNLAREEWLQQFLACQDIIQRLGTRRGAGVSASRQTVLLARKEREIAELMKSGGGGGGGGGGGEEEVASTSTQLRSEEAIGRTTGSVEWRAARGELGSGEAAIKAIQGGKGSDASEVMKVVNGEKKKEVNDSSTNEVGKNEKITPAVTRTSMTTDLKPKACLTELFSMMTLGCGKTDVCKNSLCASSLLFDESLKGLTSTQVAAKGMMMMMKEKEKVDQAVGQGCGRGQGGGGGEPR